MPRPLSSMSKRSKVKVPIQRGPNYPEILQEIEYGGTEDPADRRLVLDIPTLELLMDRARASMSGRVVINHIGFRVQLLESDGHRWEHITLLGSEPKPEVSSLRFGV